MEATLARNLSDIVVKSFAHAATSRAVVIHDLHTPLAQMLTAGYREALPDGLFLDFDTQTHAGILAMLDELYPEDLVVLVQSSRFDLQDFRFRLELFRRGLAVIEHPHLGRMPPSDIPAFIDSLAYDPDYYRTVGPALKSRLDPARLVEIHTCAGVLRYDGPFEDTKLNVGDYRGMKNTGGQFPIGEVFTEPVELTGCNGEVALFAFGDPTFSVSDLAEPATLVIREGRIVGTRDAPPALEAVLESIRAVEQQVWVRELGFGMNRAFTRHRRVTDVGTFERMCGVHMSLGQKHAVYPKATFKARFARFHVDVFVAADRVDVDGVPMFDGERYLVPGA